MNVKTHRRTQTNKQLILVYRCILAIHYYQGHRFPTGTCTI